MLCGTENGTDILGQVRRMDNEELWGIHGHQLAWRFRAQERRSCACGYGYIYIVSSASER